MATVGAFSWVSLGGEYSSAEFSLDIGGLLQTRTLTAAGAYIRLFDFSPSEGIGYLTHFSFLFPMQEKIGASVYDLSGAHFRGQFTLTFAPTFMVSLGSLGMMYLGVGSTNQFISIQLETRQQVEYLFGIGAVAGILTLFSPFGFLDVGVTAEYNLSLWVSSNNYFGWSNDPYYGMFALRPYVGWGIWVD